GVELVEDLTRLHDLAFVELAGRDDPVDTRADLHAAIGKHRPGELVCLGDRRAPRGDHRDQRGREASEAAGFLAAGEQKERREGAEAYRVRHRTVPWCFLE